MLLTDKLGTGDRAAWHWLPLHELRIHVEPLAYRAAAYFMLTMLDDPAMLALAFC